MKIVENHFTKEKNFIISNANKFINKNNILFSAHNQSSIHYSILQISDIRVPASLTVSTLDIGE